MTKQLVVACSLLLAVAGCDESEDTDTDTDTDTKQPQPSAEIPLGATISKTGTSAVGTWVNAFELAADDATEGLKDADYPTGKRLTFRDLTADSKNDAEITITKAIELVQEKGALMILNGTSNGSLHLNKLAYDDDDKNDLDVPIICVACSSPSHHNPDVENDDAATQAAFRNVDGWHFGLSMSSLYQSQVLWNIIVDRTPDGNDPGDLNGDGTVKISTIAIDDAFGTGFQDAMEEVAQEDNSATIYEKTTHPKDADPNQYDWAEAVETLTDDQTDGTEDVEPDILVEFTFPQFSLALVKAYSEAGYDLPFLHTHSMREGTVIASAEGSLDGHEGTSYLPIDGASGEAFDEHFRAVVGPPV